MIPIYICDDEHELVIYIKKMIEDIILIEDYSMEVVLATTCPDKLIQHQASQSQRAIYFLDVKLKNEDYNGFTLAKTIRKEDTRGFIIYITSYQNLMAETYKYRVEAMAYLTKDKKEALTVEIRECLSEVNDLVSKEDKDPQSYFAIKVANSVFHIPKKGILYFETSTKAHHVMIYTENRMLEFRSNISDIEKKMGEDFFRVHRSFLLRLDKIKHINYKINQIVMENDGICLMSRNGKKRLKEFFEK